MKIGLLLGSFNPIHIGHLSMATYAIASKLCDKVIFVVAMQNPWKKLSTASFQLRCDMVEASIRPFKGSCELSKVETLISEPYYSYKAIERLKNDYPTDELYLILGTDTMEKIHNWKKFTDKILPNVKFIEIARGKESDLHTDTFTLRKGNNQHVGEYDIIIPKTLDISSTMIRKMVMEGENPYPFVTEEVCEIITKNNLYENG